MPTDSFYGVSPRPHQDSLWSWRGRYNRMSFLAWNVVLSMLSIGGVWLILRLFGVVDAALLPVLAEWHQHFQLAWYGVALWLLLLIYLFAVVYIRRLHDLNQTGWLTLILVIPLVQHIFWLYLLLASGSKQANRYGQVRHATFWESVVGWAVIGLLLGTLLVFFGLGPNDATHPWQAPSQLLQQIQEQTTPYF